MKRLSEQDKKRIPGLYSELQSFEKVAQALGFSSRTISRHIKATYKRHCELVPKTGNFTVQIVYQ